MLGLLRWIGITNAAVWVGTSVFFTLVAGPLFYSGEVLRQLPVGYAGAVALLLMDRYFGVHMICSIIALGHLAAERWYAGKTHQRFRFYLLLGLLSGSVLGSAVLQPRLQSLHIKAFRPDTPSQIRSDAEQSYPLWNRMTLVLNIFLIAGIITYNWNLTSAENPYRFGASGKFRG